MAAVCYWLCVSVYLCGSVWQGPMAAVCYWLCVPVYLYGSV